MDYFVNEDYNKVARVILSVLRNLKFSTRPCPIEFKNIALRAGVSYMQARRAVNGLVDQGIIEKFEAWDGLNRRKNFYRLHV